MQKQSHYDLVVVGTGFASTFFLHQFLLKNTSAKKILVLEKGTVNSIEWQIEHKRNSTITDISQFEKQGLEHKAWQFTVGFGGSSSCWTGCTPRMLPNDFQLKTRYGVGYDWPISYDDLEPYYVMAEEIMSISGPDDWSLSHRSKAFPQPPHNLSASDKILQKAFPGRYYAQATARARVATRHRPPCCASARCHICPVNAKFTIQNEMQHVYQNERVELITEAEVMSLDLANDTARSITYKHSGSVFNASADLFVLGANGIFNPYILKVSGDTHSLIGKRLHEQIATSIIFDLKGVENFQGSTFIPGQGYMFYDGEHRREHGACMTESINSISSLRTEFGRWRERMEMVFVVEDLPLDSNYVGVGKNDKPLVVFNEYSDYGLKGFARISAYVEELRQHLPVENVIYTKAFLNKQPRPTEAHIQGTVVMGDNVETSIVDKNLVHHKYRNLLVLGSSAFPTGAPANPTLTLSAMSLMAAEKMA